MSCAQLLATRVSSIQSYSQGKGVLQPFMLFCPLFIAPQNSRIIYVGGNLRWSSSLIPHSKQVQSDHTAEGCVQLQFVTRDGNSTTFVGNLFQILATFPFKIFPYSRSVKTVIRSPRNSFFLFSFVGCSSLWPSQWPPLHFSLYAKVFLAQESPKLHKVLQMWSYKCWREVKDHLPQPGG